MDDLDGNPLYKAFLTEFSREFEIACKMSYLIAIPHSDSLDNIIIDQFLANSHILMPSKLLKMHYTPLQAGYSEDIEIEGKKLICYLGKRKPINKIIVNILAEEVGYNVYNKEYRTILIDRPLLASINNYNSRPLIRSILSPGSSPAQHSRLRKTKPSKPLTNHDDCSKYLEYISQEITMDLETDVKRLQSNYIILSQYLDDAARRIKNLAETYIPKYEVSIVRGEQNNTTLICDSVRQAIRLSVENYIVHLLHGKLISSIYNRHEKDDRILLGKFDVIHRSRLTICQLGAQSAFEDFILNDELIHEMKKLPSLQSPLAIVSSLMRLVNYISGSLNQSVRFKRLMGCKGSDKVSICSDDLIASFVFSLAQAKPANLYSISKYLETFGWSSNAKDQAAYYTATFQIVIQYVFSYTNNEKPTSVTTTNINGGGAPSSDGSLDRERTIQSNREASKQQSEHKNTSQFIDSLDSRGSTITEPDDSTLSLVATDAVRGEWELV